MSGACGTCTACCKVYAIPELEKPAGKWCQHCAVGVGCKTYHDRPRVCVDFECLWLQAQKPGNFPKMGPEARPDKCKVVFSPTTNDTIIAAITMPHAPDAWKRGAAKDVIEQLVKGGMRVSIGPPAATDLLLIDKKHGSQRVKMSEPDETGMQWRVDGGP